MSESGEKVMAGTVSSVGSRDGIDPKCLDRKCFCSVNGEDIIW